MNYTNNYHLPQWEKSDRVLMEDFNQMCRNMEAGLDRAVSHGSDAAGQAQNAAAALTAKAQAAADAAQRAADTALAAAQAAQATADNAFCPDNLPYTIGTYTGNGTTANVRIGFKPSFVIISGQYVEANVGSVNLTMLVGPNEYLKKFVTLSDTGMTITSNDDSMSMNMNIPNYIYNYIAFR